MFMVLFHGWVLLARYELICSISQAGRVRWKSHKLELSLIYLRRNHSVKALISSGAKSMRCRKT